MSESLEELKAKTALAHRILTMTGSMGDTTGHVMTRVPGADDFLMRCRNELDYSPGYVEPTALHRIDFNGIPTEPVPDYNIPPERHIGAAVFKARPEINCVIHAHPPAQVLCANAGVKLRPIVGAQNSGGAQLARGGIEVYPRAVLIHNQVISGAMMAVMGTKDVVLLKGHGNVICGRSVEEATVRAIQLENLARLCWEVALSGREAPEVPWEDVEEVIARGDIGQAGNLYMWEYYRKLYQEKRITDARIDV